MTRLSPIFCQLAVTFCFASSGGRTSAFSAIDSSSYRRAQYYLAGPPGTASQPFSSLFLASISSPGPEDEDGVKREYARVRRKRERRSYYDDDDGDFDNSIDDESDDRNGRRRVDQGAVADNYPGREIDEDIEFYDEDDAEEDNEYIDDNDDEEYSFFGSGVIPNPLLDSIDPDGAADRFPELVTDPKFLFDMFLFVVFLDFLSVVGPQQTMSVIPWS